MTTDIAPSGALPGIGDTLAGKYKIVKQLGKGGMGVVFLARHEILRQHVAIKMVLPEVALDPVFVARFMNEARAAAGIRNEHVAQVLDVAMLDTGAPYMVLEFLEGTDLSDLISAAEKDLATETCVDWVLEALEAVAQAHALGIVHRDLKPANLFLAKRQDGSEIIKVLDFGISKATNPGDVTDVAVTSTQALLGSPGYMAPEQIRSSKSVDARADVWSVGVILYKLLTKHEPFTGDSFGALFAAIFSDDPVRVRERRADVPAGLEDVVFRCLARERDQRYPNVVELARALGPFASVEGRASVDRVARTLRTGVVPASSPTTSAPPATSAAASSSQPDPAELSNVTGAVFELEGGSTADDEPAVDPVKESTTGSGRSAMAASQIHTVMDASLNAGQAVAPPPKTKNLGALKVAAAALVVGIGAVVVVVGVTGKRAAGTEGTGMVPSSDLHATTSAVPTNTASAASAEAPTSTAALAATATGSAPVASASASSTASAVVAANRRPATTPATPMTTSPASARVTAVKPAPSAKPKAPDDSVLGGGRN
jgi:serine/threonine protein kinase